MKGVAALAREKPMTPDLAGRALAEALGGLAPSYLLLNDLDALTGPSRGPFLQALLALVSSMPNGVMVALACAAHHVDAFQAEAPALSSRLNRTLLLRGLGHDEAELVLAKRMAGKRLIDDLDPLYPFTAPAVAELNAAAGGSPRRLLQLTDVVLDHAVRDRAFQVGPELVQTILRRLEASQGPAPAPSDTPPVTLPSGPTAPAPGEATAGRGAADRSLLAALRRGAHER